MEFDLQLAAFFIGSYFLGAIPFALIVSKLKKVNLRVQGSGNLGTTNVYRVMGLKYALVVFILDAAKGFIPTFLAMKLYANPSLHIGIGIMAIIGHTLTIFARFKGGKGAATGLGVLLALAPDVFTIIAILAFIIIWLTRIVSVGTIICAIVLPFLLWFFGYPIEYVGFVALICVFIIWRHKGNIGRLIRGEENRFGNGK